MLQAVAQFVNFLVIVYFYSSWREMTAARRAGMPSGVIGAGLAAWAGLLVTIGFAPQFESWRTWQFFLPSVVGPSILVMLALHAFESVRDYFASADIMPFLRLSLWRIIFGSLVGAVGLLGGVPASFAIPVMLGDVLIGVWAAWIYMRVRDGGAVSRAHLHAWNTLGLADLLDVLLLAALIVAPALAERGAAIGAILLPALGVPMFIFLHLHLFRTIQNRPQAPEAFTGGVPSAIRSNSQPRS
jgi:hypothetical protein